MSSALQQAVASIWVNDYVTVIIVIAVGYDYILTFSDEVEYIWNKPWTRVSTLFVLTRYFGLLTVVISSLLGSVFLPGPVKVILHITDDEQRFLNMSTAARRDILNIIGSWASMIFVFAADLAMILRVWALYGRSRLILITLLIFYFIEVISYLIHCIMLTFQSNPLEVTVQVLDFSFCMQQSDSPILIRIINIDLITLGGLMCLFSVIQFIKDVLQMYKATKHFRLNRYMNLLVREGMIYFLVMIIYAMINILAVSGYVSENGWQQILLGIVESIPAFTLSPRFILSLRKLYARDLRGRRGSEIDTAFGLNLSSSRGAAASAIMFADVRENRGLEEQIEVEER